MFTSGCEAGRDRKSDALVSVAASDALGSRDGWLAEAAAEARSDLGGEGKFIWQQRMEEMPCRHSDVPMRSNTTANETHIGREN